MLRLSAALLVALGCSIAAARDRDAGGMSLAAAGRVMGWSSVRAHSTATVRRGAVPLHSGRWRDESDSVLQSVIGACVAFPAVLDYKDGELWFKPIDFGNK